MKDRKTPMQKTSLSRRQLLGSAAAVAAFTIVPRHVLGGAPAAGGATQPPPSERLNLGCIGVGGMQGFGDVQAVARTENIYALCDVDEANLKKAAATFPKAKLYRDFREMLDKEQKNLNGVTITIPDFMHATASIWAMERGIGVHCQKPLTASIWESRLLAKAAKKYKVATQMGNQGYSAVATRIATEIIWNGELGDITEVHSWNSGGFSRGITEWPPAEPVPATLDWSLWQGHASEHTYSSKIHPSNWRGFLEYGTMMIGDWGIHQLGPANWALGLGETGPTSVQCIAVEGANPVTYPNYACKIDFPEREIKSAKLSKMPPVSVYWYEGSAAKMFKPPEGLTQDDMRNINEVFIGTKGLLGTTGRGEGYSLLPRSKQVGYQRPPELIKRVPGNHYQDWIRACKGGDPACSNFTISGPYTEWMLLGAISWRFPNEKLAWDGKNMRFTNNQKATDFVKPSFRKGWELQDINL
jgi:predicted dehydrogenase